MIHEGKLNVNHVKKDGIWHRLPSMSKESIRGAKQGVLNTKNAKEEPRPRLFFPPHELFKTVMLNQASLEPSFTLEQGVTLPSSYVVANYTKVLIRMPNLTSFSYLGTFG